MFCTWRHLPPWAQGGKVGSSSASFLPEPPAGSTCSRSSSCWTQSVLQSASNLRANPSLQRMCGYRICANTSQCPGQCPTTPLPLKALRFLEHCAVAQQKCSVLIKIRRRERYKPVKQTNWLSQGSSQKEQAY